MARRIIAAALALLVQLGVLSAPLAHVHPDDHDTPHRQGRALHAHLDAHDHDFGPVSGRRIDHQDDERAIAAPLFVAVAVDPVDAAAPPLHVFTLLVLPERPVGRAVLVAHGHDPPVTELTAPRPPPAYPS